MSTARSGSTGSVSFRDNSNHHSTKHGIICISASNIVATRIVVFMAKVVIYKYEFIAHTHDILLVSSTKCSLLPHRHSSSLPVWTLFARVTSAILLNGPRRCGCIFQYPDTCHILCPGHFFTKAFMSECRRTLLIKRKHCRGLCIAVHRHQTRINVDQVW